MTGIDWALVVAGVLFVAWICWVLWRLQAWAERDFDRHTDMATAIVNPPDAEARRRHPATRALSGGPGCDRCDAPGPAREHIHRRGHWR